MSNDNNSGRPGPSISDIRARSGMMEGTAEDLSKVLPPEEMPREETPKVDLEKKDESPKEETKSETKSDSEEDEEEEDEEDESDEENDGANASKSKDEAPAKPSRPLKTAFKQIGDLRKGQEEMQKGMGTLAEAVAALTKAVTPSEKKEATAEAKESITDLLAKAKDAGADPEWLAAFAKTITESLKSELKGEFDKELSTIKSQLEETGKTAAELKAEKDAMKARSETLATFTNEWNDITPQLQKEFPNATPALLKEARTLMQKLAISKDYGGESLDGTENIGKAPMPLDYILFKERAKFATILNVKKGSSGEKATTEPAEERTDFEENGEEQTLGMDPSPARFKAFQQKRMADANKYAPNADIEIIPPLGR